MALADGREGRSRNRHLAWGRGPLPGAGRVLAAALAFWLVLQYPGDRYYTIMGPYTREQCLRMKKEYGPAYGKARCVQFKIVIPDGEVK